MAGDAVELIIPVYLNQRMVFDLTAMLRDGIATVSRVTSTDGKTIRDDQRYGAEFGLSKALASLVRVGVSGERKKGLEAGQQSVVDEEKVHTPASLFHSLRAALRSSGSLKLMGSDFLPAPGQIVEFEASLRRNSLIEVMDTFGKMMGMAIAFEEQPGRQGKQVHGKAPSGKSENHKILEQISAFAKELKAGDTVDIVTGTLANGYRSVITLESEYLNDPTMADLVDGNFNVLGKVIRTIPAGMEAGVSLLRKSALGALPPGLMNGITSSLRGLADTQGFRLPEMEFEIRGPVFQVLPIAVFA